MIKFFKKNQFQSWKQINFRSVETTLGIEFLHDLYNSYWPPINSLRFRNTILTINGKEATSYAPIEEWNFLAEWFGEKFLRGDDKIYKEINNLIKYQKPRLAKLLSKIKITNLKKIDNIELGLLLIDFHYTVLSEIYRVNLVQIEHSLNYAIDKELVKYYPSKIKRDEIIANVIMANEPTVATKEEKDFLNLVYEGLQKGVVKIQNFTLSSKHKWVIQKIKEHHQKYSFVHCAYGANPYSLNYYIDRYYDLTKHGLNDLKNRIKIIEEAINRMKIIKNQYLKKIKKNKILIKNINFLTAIGSLRDKNKALLGTTIYWRAKILNEIARRKKIKKEKLNLYFLAEICDLLKYNKKIPSQQIKLRQGDFAVIRKEYLDFNQKKIKRIMAKNFLKSKMLRGICASTGIYTGIVKIIRSGDDIYKMKEGNIMVSPGTDFNLINTMQKAGAIITEEGGILSHAAVVSRELNIPCIIGVQNATNILKDGYKIKIIATKGLIIKQ